MVLQVKKAEKFSILLSPGHPGFFVCGRMSRFGLTMKKVILLRILINATTKTLYAGRDTLWYQTYDGFARNFQKTNNVLFFRYLL